MCKSKTRLVYQIQHGDQTISKRSMILTDLGQTDDDKALVTTVSQDVNQKAMRVDVALSE